MARGRGSQLAAPGAALFSALRPGAAGAQGGPGGNATPGSCETARAPGAPARRERRGWAKGIPRKELFKGNSERRQSLRAVTAAFVQWAKF